MVLTREEKIVVLTAGIGGLLGFSVGYRPTGFGPPLLLLAELPIVVMVSLFAAGVQFRKVWSRWRPRMLLALIGIAVLPLAMIAGVEANRLDFKYLRKKQYEAWIATIRVPPEANTGDYFEVQVPMLIRVDGRVWARRQSDGQLRVDFSWARKIWYVYCGGHECAPDEHWSYKRIDEHWFLASRR